MLKKLDASASEAMMLGYEKTKRACKLLDEAQNKALLSREVLEESESDNVSLKKNLVIMLTTSGLMTEKISSYYLMLMLNMTMLLALTIKI